MTCIPGIPASGKNPLSSAPLRRRPDPNSNGAIQEQLKSVDELVTPETVSALERALGYLASRQVRSGKLQGAFGTNGYASGVAVTALAGTLWKLDVDSGGARNRTGDGEATMRAALGTSQ